MLYNEHNKNWVSSITKKLLIYNKFNFYFIGIKSIYIILYITFNKYNIVYNKYLFIRTTSKFLLINNFNYYKYYYTITLIKQQFLLYT